MSRFWTTVQESLVVYNMQDAAPLIERAIPSFARTKFQRLLAWTDTLTGELNNNAKSATHVYLFQYITACDPWSRHF